MFVFMLIGLLLIELGVFLNSVIKLRKIKKYEKDRSH